MTGSAVVCVACWIRALGLSCTCFDPEKGISGTLREMLTYACIAHSRSLWSVSGGTPISSQHSGDRQLFELKATLVYIASSKPARAS